MSSYGQLLKKMLSFTDTKLLVLANYCDYDISYISKWCSGSKFPSSKNVYSVHRRMSDFFSKEIISKSQCTEYFMRFDLAFPEEKEMIENHEFLGNSIFKLLNDAYCKENSTFEIPQEEVKLIFGKEDIFSFLEEKLKSILLIQEIFKLEFFFTTDFTFINLSPILKLLSNLKKQNMSIFFNIVIDFSRLDENIERKINILFYLLNRYANLNFEIYQNNYLKWSNILLLKEHFALQYSLNFKGEFEMGSFVQNKEVLNNLSNLLLNGFKKENQVLNLVNTDKLQEKGYRTTFYTSDFYNFFLVRGFEFLLPANIIDNIVKHAKKNNYPEQTLKSILRVKIAWEEVFENSSVNFFILKKSIFEYFEKGELTYMNVQYRTSPEERQLHYENILDVLEKNSNIHFYILDDDFICKKNLNYNLGIFANHERMFLKNYYSLQYRKEPYFTILNNKKLLKHINTYFENLKKSEFCKEYTIEDFKYFWEKYKNMFFRLTEL